MAVRFDLKKTAPAYPPGKKRQESASSCNLSDYQKKNTFLCFHATTYLLKICIFAAESLLKEKSMSETKRIKTALVSVYHKDGLDAILAKLHEEGVEFMSTGGTRQFIESLGYPCKARELESDQQQVAQYEIPEIDLVIVDLYPFEDTVASGASEQDIIEKIDIGGISLIRAGAKNFNDVVIVASKHQYQPLLDILKSQGAETTREQRRWFAGEAFTVSSHYDSAIRDYFKK